MPPGRPICLIPDRTVFLSSRVLSDKDASRASVSGNAERSDCRAKLRARGRDGFLTFWRDVVTNLLDAQPAALPVEVKSEAQC